MPRKITIKDLKNKRDYNAWKIELEDHKMADTHAKHDAAVAELARRDTLKDTLWEAAVPFFGINISPEELKAKFELIMNDSRNAGIVRQLREREEERVRALETEDMTRVEELMLKHAKLIDDLNAAREKGEKITDEVLTGSEENSAVPKDPDT